MSNHQSQEEIDFFAPIDHVKSAVLVTGEHDSDHVIQNFTTGMVSGRHCAKCGIFEEDDGDAGIYAGDSPRSVLSENLEHCKDCGDCVVHRGCANNGRCPHCAFMQREEEIAKALEEDIPFRRAHELEVDSRDLIKRAERADNLDLVYEMIRLSAKTRENLDAYDKALAAAVVRLTFGAQALAIAS